MAGGVMSQVQGIIPGMRRGGEEEVPDPAPQEEYQEYQVIQGEVPGKTWGGEYQVIQGAVPNEKNDSVGSTRSYQRVSYSID